MKKKNEQVHINKIFQDRAGFLWYGTNSGLFKFDGASLQHFTTQAGLPDNIVTAIAQDSLGRIWTGHRSGKVAFIEKNVIREFSPEEGTSTEEISDIVFDREGNLWFSTFNDGLYCYINSRLYRFDTDNGLPDIFIYDIAEDSQGTIWIGTDGGAVSCKMIDAKITVDVFNSSKGLPDNIIKKILPGENNSILMATEDAGIIIYHPLTGKHDQLITGDWKWGPISDFLVSGSQVWIALQQTGLLIFDINTKQLKHYNNKIEPSLVSITTLLEDAEGNIWVGSKTGVARTLGDRVESFDNFDITKDVNILSLTFDKNNDLWFSNSEGLFKRQVLHDKVTITKPLAGKIFQKYTVVSLYCDVEGFIWAGLYGEGVLRINPSNNAVAYINKELRNGNVLSITGKGKVIWLATLGGSARINIDGDKLAIKTYGKQDGLISDYIYQVFVDSRDRIWFATDGKGADMLDDEGFHHYEGGLTSKVVYGFAEDAKHTIWANTQGEGLYKFERKSFKKDGLKFRDNNVVAMNIDNFGNLIVMHDLGIDALDVKNNKIRYVSDEKNIMDKLANLNATARDKYGRVYFGTNNGILSSSSISHQYMAKPKPSITGLRILNKKTEMSQNLVLAYDQNSVTINFLGIWYQNPHDLKFQYVLSGYDHDWIIGSDRSATYSSLPPGDYTFRLRTSDTENFNNAEEATYQFTIAPPFWRTKVFYALVLITSILGGYGIIKFRERKLVRDTLILKHKVEIRTNEILKKNEEINAQAEEIKGINENLEMLVRERTAELEKKNKALEESAFIIAHELRAPVASILGLINLMSKAELEQENKVIVDHMTDSAGRLNSIVRSITIAIEQGDTKS